MNGKKPAGRTRRLDYIEDLKINRCDFVKVNCSQSKDVVVSSKFNKKRIKKKHTKGQFA